MQTQVQQNSILDSALEYHSMGFSILPVKTDGSKKPDLKSWTQYQTQRADEQQVRDWFIAGDKNIGVMCGKVSSGLCIVDFDDEKLYLDWKAQNQDFAEAIPTVKTRRGYHIWGLSNDGKTENLTGLDVKRSGYVVCPPSRFEGGFYDWIVPLSQGLRELDIEGIKNCVFGSKIQKLDTDIKKAQSSQTTQTKQRAQTSQVIVPVVQLTPEQLAPYQERINTFIEQTLPDKVGCRNKQIFQFARRLQSIPELKNVDPASLREVCRQWFERAKPFIGSKDFYTTFVDFRKGWPLIKYPDLKAIFDEASKNIPPIAKELYKGEPDVQKLAALCAALASLQDSDGTFFLGCRAPAKLLNRPASTIANWLKGFTMDGVLTVISKGYQNRENPLDKEATEYEYNY